MSTITECITEKSKDNKNIFRIKKIINGYI